MFFTTPLVCTKITCFLYVIFFIIFDVDTIGGSTIGFTPAADPFPFVTFPLKESSSTKLLVMTSKATKVKIGTTSDSLVEELDTLEIATNPPAKLAQKPATTMHTTTLSTVLLKSTSSSMKSKSTPPTTNPTTTTTSSKTVTSTTTVQKTTPGSTAITATPRKLILSASKMAARLLPRIISDDPQSAADIDRLISQYTETKNWPIWKKKMLFQNIVLLLDHLPDEESVNITSTTSAAVPIHTTTTASIPTTTVSVDHTFLLIAKKLVPRYKNERSQNQSLSISTFLNSMPRIRILPPEARRVLEQFMEQLLTEEGEENSSSAVFTLLGPRYPRIMCTALSCVR